MKTSMQELIEKLQYEVAQNEMPTTSFMAGVLQGLNDTLVLAESMLEKEKDVMKSCIVMGMEFIPVDPNHYNEDAEEIYNEIFNTNEMIEEPFKNSSTDTVSGMHLPEQLQDIELQTEMKQSSIEFMYNVMFVQNGRIKFEDWEQVKEMHKEEIMDAFQEGKWDGWQNHKLKVNNKECQWTDPAYYYNETFNIK